MRYLAGVAGFALTLGSMGIASDEQLPTTTCEDALPPVAVLDADEGRVDLEGLIGDQVSLVDGADVLTAAEVDELSSFLGDDAVGSLDVEAQLPDGERCRSTLALIRSSEASAEDRVAAAAITVGHMRALGVDVQSDEAIIAFCDSQAGLTPCDLVDSTTTVERTGEEVAPDAFDQLVSQGGGGEFLASDQREFCKTIRLEDTPADSGTWFQGRFEAQAGSPLFSNSQAAEVRAGFPEANEIRLLTQYQRGSFGSDLSRVRGQVGYGVGVVDQTGDDPEVRIAPALEFDIEGTTFNSAATILPLQLPGSAVGQGRLDVESFIEKIATGQRTSGPSPQPRYEQVTTASPPAGVTTDRADRARQGRMDLPIISARDGDQFLVGFDARAEAEAEAFGASMAQSETDLLDGGRLRATAAEFEIVAPDDLFWFSDRCID